MSRCGLCRAFRSTNMTKPKNYQTLALFLAVELSTEELRALTVACVGAPRLERVAEAAESAIKTRDGHMTAIARMTLINAILDDGVLDEPDEEEDESA